MTHDGRQLKREDLEELWDALKLADAPLVGNERPGLRDAEMDDICAPLGLVLSSEARVWWSWIDGVRSADRPAAGKVGPWFVMSLHEAVEDTLRLRSLRDSVPDTIPEFWRASYISFVRGDWMMAADLDVPAGDASPIYSIDGKDDRFPTDPQLPSIGALIRLWTRAISGGLWLYDSGSDHWLVEGALEGVPRGLP